MSNSAEEKPNVAPLASADKNESHQHSQKGKASVDRLEELRKRIREGTYHVDPEALAGALLRLTDVAD